jgi:hypothetical protein
LAEPTALTVNMITFVILIFGTIIGSTGMMSASMVEGQYEPRPNIITPIISTSGQFNTTTGALFSSHNLTDYESSNVPGLMGNPCPEDDEIAVYVHGVWAGPAQAKEQLDRTKMSLNASGYDFPLIGFTWDSDTSVDKDGWGIAKLIADQNGAKLAQFISDFKNNCEFDNIRVISHSLGARVVGEALTILDTQQAWEDRNRNFNKNITSVHLMAAAIDNDVLSANTPLGIAISHIVNNFYNLYNPEDNALQFSYVQIEQRIPLGLSGISDDESAPGNYSEWNVKNEIPPFQKANGTSQPFCDYSVYFWGDNHCGYMGFRQQFPFNQFLLDDGAINVVVSDWSSQS